MVPSSFNELQVLSEVDAAPEITQRQLAQRVGIALGLTNSLMRNLVKKGYVRAQEASWKRRMYVLTANGLSHKVRLTVSYIRHFLNHYQKVRQTLREQIVPLALHEESRVAILGPCEFAELVYLGLKELRIEDIDILSTDPEPGSQFLGLPVQYFGALKSSDYDWILIAQPGQPSYEELVKLFDEEEVSDKLFTFFPESNHGDPK